MINLLRKKKIAVLSGGYSVEREISLQSGKKVLESLLRLGYLAIPLDPAYDNILDHDIDIVFNSLHGSYGEDGTIQSFLDYYSIPYTGSGASASLMCMNKLITKRIFEKENIPTPQFHPLTKGLPLSHPFDFPLIIKPIDEGSSVGIHVLHTKEEFEHNVPPLLERFGGCLLEPFTKGAEITVGIVEKDGVPIALPILELCPKNEFYDYDAKYTPGMTNFILPARLSTGLTTTCQQLALQVHHLMACNDLSRVDMIVCPTQGPLVLEINTLPGMTELSDLPAQAKHAGMSFDTLVETILHSAARRAFV